MRVLGTWRRNLNIGDLRRNQYLVWAKEHKAMAVLSKEYLTSSQSASMLAASDLSWRFETLP